MKIPQILTLILTLIQRKYSRTVKYKRGCANVLTQPHETHKK